MATPSQRDPPTVSVVVPTYGRPAYLPEALESVGDQTYDDVELIVVDDHSPEPVAPVVEGCSLGLQSVQCIRHEENRGANAARNTGIEAASGEFVAFLDDDDLWKPRYLARVVEAFNDPDVGLVSAGARVVDGDDRRIGVHRPEFSEDPLDDLLDGVMAGSFSRFAVRASLIETVGLLDERLPSWQDWEWQFRLARHCRFASIPAPLVIHRMANHDQITDDFTDRRDVSYPILLERHREAIARRSGRDERRFVAVLSRSLAASALHNGAYASAIRYLLRSLRRDPTATGAYPYLAAAIGGPLTYRPMKWLKRQVGERQA